MRLVCCLVVALLAISPAVAQRASSPDGAQTPNILCEGAAAEAVEPLPEMVRDWVIVLCTPAGQTLAAHVEDKVILWLLHDTARNFMLPAVPREFVAKNPRFPDDQLRFVAFSARQMTGENCRLSLELWKRAFDTATVPETMGDIVQLDAQSVYEGIVYSLFFYLRDGTPRWLLACIDRCNRSVSIDVPQGAELEARIAGQNKGGG